MGTSATVKPGAHRLVGQLDLKLVAVGVHAVEVDALEHPPVEALEAAGEVAHRHAQSSRA